MVIISHFHGDHIGGLVTAEGVPAFPNAEIRVPVDEWNYWLDDVNMNKAAEGSNLRNAHGNVRRVFGAIPGKNLTKFEERQGGRARHHVACDAGPYAGTYLVRNRFGFRQAAGAGRCDLRHRAGIRAQSGLVRRRRHGRTDGGRDPAQALRHARRREDADDRAIICRSRRSGASRKAAAAIASRRWRDAVEREWSRPACAGRFDFSGYYFAFCLSQSASTRFRFPAP